MLLEPRRRRDPFWFWLFAAGAHDVGLADSESTAVRAQGYRGARLVIRGLADDAAAGSPDRSDQVEDFHLAGIAVVVRGAGRENRSVRRQRHGLAEPVARGRARDVAADARPDLRDGGRVDAVATT